VQSVNKRNINLINKENKQRRGKIRNGGKRMKVIEQEGSSRGHLPH